MNSIGMLFVGVLVLVSGVFSAPAPDTGLNGLHIANGDGKGTITGLSGPLPPPEPFPQVEQQDNRARPADQSKAVEPGHVHPNAEEEASHSAPSVDSKTTSVVPSSTLAVDGKASQSPKDLDTANSLLLGLGLLKLGAVGAVGLGFYGGLGYGYGYGYGYPGIYGGYGYGYPGVGYGYPPYGGIPPY